MTSKAQHKYSGGRHRPENAQATKYPADKDTPVVRGTCRECGGNKAVHSFS